MSEQTSSTIKKKGGRPPKFKQELTQETEDNSLAQKEEKEVDILFQHDCEVMARIARQLPLFVKAMGSDEHKGFYVVDPYNGNKLTGCFKEESEATVALKKLREHENEVYMRAAQ